MRAPVYLVGALASGLVGCIYIPPPEHSAMAVNGRYRAAISDEKVAQISVGKTTRADVLLAFGRPTQRIQDDRYFAYDWATVQGYFAFGIAPGAGGFGAVPNRYLLLIEFDPDGVLRRFTKIETGYSFRNIEKAQDEWIAAGATP
jgi:outer membrane protein assembly factor BamE (lipoprotein component of BamABCDE complex)